MKDNAKGTRIDLKDQISIFKQMIDRKAKHYDSEDTLDLGEGCWISHWYLGEEQWATDIAFKSLKSLNALNERGIFEVPANRRLAFREFGAVCCHDFKTREKKL